jgi:hypothetical protein
MLAAVFLPRCLAAWLLSLSNFNILKKRCFSRYLLLLLSGGVTQRRFSFSSLTSSFLPLELTIQH